MFEPVIKWSGSKRSQANEIIEYFPSKINTYYEPFVGGASLLRALLQSNIKVNKYICSDINKDLINLWNCIKKEPELIANEYNTLWSELNKDNDMNRKKNFFNFIRDRYNNLRSPSDFMFIMRTTTNGMPRYNKNGDFNNSFHVTRNGINPKRLEKIIYEWSNLLNENNVEFICTSYENIQPLIDDYIYLDPPYFHTKGMYYGNINYNQFWEWLRTIKCNYSLSFDGISGDINNTYNVPEDVYSKHIYIHSGNSSFKRVIGKSNNSIVYESLYIK